MNLQNVRVYQEVIENRGMSAAARKLGLSPTAVSKQIKVLEKELAIQLIKRTSSHFSVTDAGQFLYESCIAILRDFDGLKESIRFLHTTPTGNLKVFATQAFSEKFITPNLKEFRQQFPGILLNIDIADRYPDLQKEGIDLCLGIMKGYRVLI